MRSIQLLSLVVLALGYATLSAQPRESISAAAVPGDFKYAIDAQLATGKTTLLRNGNFSRDREAIREFYESRHYRPVWFESGQVTRQGVLLLQTLRNTDRYGLRPDDYDGTALVYRAIAFVTNGAESANAELDLAITVAAARLIRHLHFGRIDPRQAEFDVNRGDFDLSGALQTLSSNDNPAQVLASVEPQFLHYQLLKQAMYRYRDLAMDRELTNLPNFKARSIKPNEPYEGAGKLRALLLALGDLPADTSTSDSILDDALATGVARFQQRHGLTVDGALGRKTFAALTTPLSVRAEQLALALERWRWLPEFSTPPIIVNIPQFRLFAFRSMRDEAAQMLQMDVIVGKNFPTTRTPAFTAELKYVVLRPYWDVPPTIQRDEMVPAIRANPGYLDKNNLEIIGADGNPVTYSPEALDQLAAGTVRLRQKPGDENSLGLVKLMLPNAYNVYLHATPAPRLFKETTRAFSHGCIRLSDPAGLVEHVLRNQRGEWTREKIEAAMRDELPQANNRHVFLEKPIPVLIVYATAMVQESGDVQFFEDIYGHDQKLKKLLKTR
jgi:L,D-transpeptidase YcbB